MIRRIKAVALAASLGVLGVAQPASAIGVLPFQPVNSDSAVTATLAVAAIVLVGLGLGLVLFAPSKGN